MFRQIVAAVDIGLRKSILRVAFEGCLEFRDRFGELPLVLHAAFIAAYRAQRWDEAIALKAKASALEVPGLEKLYDIYSHRIEDYLANPPGADWDGAYTATEK